MKKNTVYMVLGVAALLAGLGVMNAFMNPGPIQAAQMERSAEVAERIQLAEAAGDTGTDSSDWPTVAPDEFKVKFITTAGDFVLQVHKDWAPVGVERFYQILREGVYDDARFFRVVPGYVVQWGIPGDPAVAAEWSEARIKDDPVIQSNTPGTISFATSGPDSRTTQVFINYGDNANLDGMGFAPFGKVVEGFDNVKAINAQYAQRPNQGLIQSRGNAYLKEAFPELDYIVKVELITGDEEAAEDAAEEPADEPEAKEPLDTEPPKEPEAVVED